MEGTSNDYRFRLATPGRSHSNEQLTEIFASEQF